MVQTKNKLRQHPTPSNMASLREIEYKTKKEILAAKKKSWENYVSTITSFTIAQEA